MMFFGLCNAPATFQTFVNDIFRDLIRCGKIVVYLDDILIFSETLEEHRQLVREVFSVLREHRLYLKPAKCKFETLIVKFLGYIIGNAQICMDPSKVEAVANWPAPGNKKQLQQFLGLANWLQRFVKGYSSVVKPLTRLTGDVQWEWAQTEQVAFEEIKKRLTSAPVLTIPNDDDPF